MTIWPRLYCTTLTQRLLMSPDELKGIWDEYREFWRGHEGHSNRTEQSDFQRDHDQAVASQEWATR